MISSLNIVKLTHFNNWEKKNNLNSVLLFILEEEFL